VSKLVPLLREGADDCERALLAAARQDGPPDPSARLRALEAARAASRAAAVVGMTAVGLRWLQTLKPATIAWLTAGGVGLTVAAVGGALVATQSPDAHPAAALQPHVVVPSTQASAPSFPAPSASPKHESLPSALSAPTSPPQAGPAPSPVVRPREPPLAPAVIARGPTATDVVAAREPAAGGTVDPAPGSPAPATASARAPTLSREAALLESAREAVAKSRVDQALSLLDAYDAQFASGVLAEEAIVLRVQALLAGGRPQEARQIAADFERRHPGSSYAPRLRALLQKGDRSVDGRPTR
jgi:hypothetical protein